MMELIKSLRPYGGAWVWASLVVLTGAILWLTISVEEINWSLGAFHPSPLSHTMPEEDFSNLWSAGQLVRMGKLDWLYSANLFQEWKENRFGSPLYVNDWIYPPTVLLVGVPLSFLPLVPAYLLWDIGTLAIAVCLLRYARLSWPILIVGLAAPATWRSLILGQYGVVTGALVVAGLLMAPRYPIRAGIMLGLSTIKPQQGIVVPIAWLAAHYWRAFAVAAATFGILSVGVGLWLGSHAWVLFLVQSSAMAREILNAPPPQPYIGTGVSVFWMLRTMGSGIAPAYAVHCIFAVVAIFFVYRAWRIPNAEPMARMAVTACLSLIITPYGFAYDMVAYSIGVAAIVANNKWRLRFVDVILWLWPAYCPVVTVVSGALFTPLIILVAATQAWNQMVQGERSMLDYRRDRNGDE